MSECRYEYKCNACGSKIFTTKRFLSFARGCQECDEGELEIGWFHNKPMYDPKPLLTIVLDDIGSVPTVTYKGEEIKLKTNISFEWDTRDALNLGGTSYKVEHLEEGHGMNVLNVIEKRTNEHID